MENVCVGNYFNLKTPRRMAEENLTDRNVVSLDRYRWKWHCNGLYQRPVAALVRKSYGTTRDEFFDLTTMWQQEELCLESIARIGHDGC